MSDTPDMFEGRLSGYSKQSRADGDWIEVRFQIHPQDVTPALASAPLKTVFMVAAVPAEKQPEKKAKRKWHEISLPEQANIRCKDHAFQGWLDPDIFLSPVDQRASLAKDLLLMRLGLLESFGTLGSESSATGKWLALDEQFRKDMGLEAEEVNDWKKAKAALEDSDDA